MNCLLLPENFLVLILVLQFSGFCDFNQGSLSGEVFVLLTEKETWNYPDIDFAQKQPWGTSLVVH